MTPFVWQLLSVALFLACLASFIWGMRSFFVQPAGTTAGMRLTGICGSISALVQLAVLLQPGSVTGGRGLAAAILYSLALALFWWAIAANRRKPLSAVFSPDAPAHLVQEGPYRYLRHPFYCSYLVTWIAGVVATGQLWLLATVAVMLAIYIRAAKMEEQKFSASDLAVRYESYRARTGLFLPNPWKALSSKRRTANI
jgi:protein-S-isoprenylcysteine O-methyltransferase Ste14